MGVRPRYTEDFRRDAVARVIDTGRPASQVARDLGVGPDTLRRWVRQHGAPTTPTPESRPGSAAESAAALNGQQPDGPDDLLGAFSRVPLRLRLLLVVLVWAGTLLVSTQVTATESVRAGALVVHVLSLVVAFGAVLVVDWHGVLWLASRRGLHESIRLAAASVPLIWTGVVGLLASGAFLNPDLSTGLTWVKLLLVLVVALNGTVTASTAGRLRDLPRSVAPAGLPRNLQARVMTATAVSQVGWWGAILIGFLTAAPGA
ncbi:MAG: transposase [Nocardioidaceae bacterium]